MADSRLRPAFYAARPGRWRDWWSLLHPPYTAWHLAYVAIGASLAAHLDAGRLAVTLLAFFAAVGVGCHALDERAGHPLRTGISDRALVAAGVAGLGVAVALGVAGIVVVGWALAPFVVVGPFLAAAYNLEWFDGRLHTDPAFALAWGAFPVVTAYVAQTGTIDPAVLVAAAAAAAIATAQRCLSTPARQLRRKVASVQGTTVFADGRTEPIDATTLLTPLEGALRALSWGVVGLAAAMVLARLT